MEFVYFFEANEQLKFLLLTFRYFAEQWTAEILHGLGVLLKQTFFKSRIYFYPLNQLTMNACQ